MFEFEYMYYVYLLFERSALDGMQKSFKPDLYWFSLLN